MRCTTTHSASTIVNETLGWRGGAVDTLMFVLGGVLALWGLRAVFAVFG